MSWPLALLIWFTPDTFETFSFSELSALLEHKVPDHWPNSSGQRYPAPRRPLDSSVFCTGGSQRAVHPPGSYREESRAAVTACHAASRVNCQPVLRHYLLRGDSMMTIFMGRRAHERAGQIWHHYLREIMIGMFKIFVFPILPGHT